MNLLGSVNQALDYYRKSLKIREQIASLDPNNGQAQRDLLVSYIRLGSIEIQSNNNPAAKSWLEKALPIAEKLAEDKINAKAQQDLKIMQDVLSQIK